MIYAKNGERPSLLEELVERFPRAAVIHYGQYDRSRLFDVARRSRACAYLADDDHGPLALEEILLAGCPAVGVRTGASFVRHGITGFHVPSLPPGLASSRNKTDRANLDTYVTAIRLAQNLDRSVVRDEAVKQFDTNAIVDTIARELRSLC